MSKVVRVALPGYNAKTDTNLDHFALYTDEDNVLIKEKTRGQITVGAGVDQVIPHNLGYVPLFLVFINDTGISANTWSLVGIGSILSTQFVASANTTDLIISNLTGGSLTFKYFIFYDNQVGSSGITLTESDRILKIAKQGYDVLTEKDPNNLIFHSDLNCFKIVYQGSHDLTFNVSAVPVTYSFPHNSPLSSTTCILLFVKFPDGKVTTVAWYGTQGDSCKAYTFIRSFDSVYFDNTNIYLRNSFVGTSYVVSFAWYIFEANL